MRRSLRQQVRELYGGACGYCSVAEGQAGAELTVDHYRPQSVGGEHALENLVYCCPACNSFKGDYWSPGDGRRILHPLQDDLSLHLAEDSDGLLHARTPTGQFHIDRLQLNRPPLLLHRQLRRREQQQAQERAALVQALSSARDEIQSLLRQFGVDAE